MDERAAAEQAAELAKTLSASSNLEIRYGSRHDLAEENRTGFQVMRPDGTATYWLNGAQISKELYAALVPIFEEARKRQRRDPRWNWVDVTKFGQDPADPSYIKGSCRHVELEPVSGVDANRLFRCGTCGAHLQTVPAPK